MVVDSRRGWDADFSMTATHPNVIDSGSCWADNPAIVRIARQIKATVAMFPEFINDRDAKTEIIERDTYIQVLVVCTFRVPK